MEKFLDTGSVASIASPAFAKATARQAASWRRSNPRFSCLLSIDFFASLSRLSAAKAGLAMTTFGRWLAMTALLVLAISSALPAIAQDAVTPPEPIKIGEMMPYTAAPNYAYSFREGWQMAVEEINAAGGVKGRPLEVVSRDDKGRPDEGVRLTQELMLRDKVVVIMGAAFDNVGLAVANWANHYKFPFIKQWGAVCEKIEAPDNKYWFVNDRCTNKTAAIYAAEAAKNPAKRWATIASNYEWGRQLVAAFKSDLKRLRPDVEFVAERYPTFGKIQAQSEIRAMKMGNPDAVFNALFEGDLANYLRMADVIDFCKSCYNISGAVVLAVPSGMRQYSEFFPRGWFTLGIPNNVGNHPSKAFIEKYKALHGKNPDLIVLDGYNTMLMVAEALRNAKTLSPDDIRDALSTVTVSGPFGKVSMNPVTKQPNIGAWVGYTDRIEGKGEFVNWQWKSYEELLPAEKTVAPRAER